MSSFAAQAKDGLDLDDGENPATVRDAALAASKPHAASEGGAQVAQQPDPAPTAVLDWEPAQGYAAVASDPSEAALTEVAQRVFGFPGFRGLQLAVIQRVLAGQSTLAIMPTGEPPSHALRLPC